MDASELWLCAARPSQFVGAVLSVFRGVLVQLRFDDFEAYKVYKLTTFLGKLDEQSRAETAGRYFWEKFGFA